MLMAPLCRERLLPLSMLKPTCLAALLLTAMETTLLLHYLLALTR